MAFIPLDINRKYDFAIVVKRVLPNHPELALITDALAGLRHRTAVEPVRTVPASRVVPSGLCHDRCRRQVLMRPVARLLAVDIDRDDLVTRTDDAPGADTDVVLGPQLGQVAQALWRRRFLPSRREGGLAPLPRRLDLLRWVIRAGQGYGRESERNQPLSNVQCVFQVIMLPTMSASSARLPPNWISKKDASSPGAFLGKGAQ